ncbi:MAG TPA: hypothetical protein VN622_05940 [Clostridia bacterium]|nr:hypothetical protein [Clostridia bacterium]
MKDEEILGKLFEMTGYCEAVVGIRFKKTAPRPDNKHLGRLIEQIAYHVREISNELHEFARGWGYE